MTDKQKEQAIEKLAKHLFIKWAKENSPDKVGVWEQLTDSKELWLSDARSILSLLYPAELPALWLDVPDKAGEWWMSAHCDGQYIEPSILRVIDYGRADRGLEVDHHFPHETVPVKEFTEEYYPKSKWLYIPEPSVMPMPE